MLASIEGNEKAYREEIVNYLTWQEKMIYFFLMEEYLLLFCFTTFFFFSP